MTLYCAASTFYVHQFLTLFVLLSFYGNFQLLKLNLDQVSTFNSQFLSHVVIFLILSIAAPKVYLAKLSAIVWLLPFAPPLTFTLVAIFVLLLLFQLSQPILVLS